MGLTNSQYDSIMRIYNERQSYAKRTAAARRKEISEKIPEYDDIDNRIASLSIDFAIASLESNNAGSLNDLQAQISKLSAYREELLTGNGYPKDYLAPIYFCRDCQDIGYVNNEKCHCFKKEVIDLLYSGTNAKNIQKEETFENFSLTPYSKSFKDSSTNTSSYDHMAFVRDTVKKFADDFNTNPSANLLFYGNTGLGKSFLSNCVANELIKQCHSVISLSAIELFHIFSKSEFNRDEEQEELSDEILSCDLLIIDDLGTELSNTFTTSRLFYCINERILKGKATIISTNFDLTKLQEQYSDRIFSRIMHSYKVIKFFGNNIRLSAFHA
jgi:DNA replication protein DnaC